MVMTSFFDGDGTGGGGGRADGPLTQATTPALPGFSPLLTSAADLKKHLP